MNTQTTMFATETIHFGKLAALAPKLYSAPVIRLRAVRESSVEVPRQIVSPSDVASMLMTRFGDSDREVLVVVALDTHNRVIGIEPCFVGSLNASMVTMREVFKYAVLANAAAIIIAHNHPSGDVTPSPEDVLVTRQIVDAGKLLDIDVLDHLIVSDTKYISMREKGLGWSR